MWSSYDLNAKSLQALCLNCCSSTSFVPLCSPIFQSQTEARIGPFSNNALTCLYFTCTFFFKRKKCFALLREFCHVTLFIREKTRKVTFISSFLSTLLHRLRQCGCWHPAFKYLLVYTTLFKTIRFNSNRNRIEMSELTTPGTPSVLPTRRRDSPHVPSRNNSAASNKQGGLPLASSMLQKNQGESSRTEADHLVKQHRMSIISLTILSIIFTVTFLYFLFNIILPNRHFVSYYFCSWIKKNTLSSLFLSSAFDVVHANSNMC